MAATINAGGPGLGDLADTFNQNGLSSNYVSAVTDFDAYLLTGPIHVSEGFEWFSNQVTTSAEVTYDLGDVHTIGRVALWNENLSGIGLLSLLGSTDDATFFPLLQLPVVPNNNFDGFDYGPDILQFVAPTALRYVRFSMSGCPQTPDFATFPACGIGEVAFAEVEGAVPEPASLFLLGLGLTAVAILRRRRRTTH